MTQVQTLTQDLRLKLRQGLERTIVMTAAKELIRQGLLVAVDDGGAMACKRTSDLTVIGKAIMSTDEDVLHAYLPTGERLGWLYFVYGNSGWDVWADTWRLEGKLPRTEALVEAYADRFAMLEV